MSISMSLVLAAFVASNGQGAPAPAPTHRAVIAPSAFTVFSKCAAARTFLED